MVILRRTLSVIFTTTALFVHARGAATVSPQKPTLETKKGDYIPGLMQWIADHYEATRAYRAGDTEGAMTMLSQRTVSEQRQIVERVIGVLQVKSSTTAGGTAPGGAASGGADASQRISGVPYTNPDQRTGAVKPSVPAAGKDLPSDEPVFTWTVDMLPAAGALHMEAALRAYRRDAAASPRDVGDQIKIARAYFDYYERRTERTTASSRWERAIGLSAMADGRFGMAATILDDACAAFPTDAPLHLACGSIHETIAMMPADAAAALVPSHTDTPVEDNPLTEFDESRANRYRGGITLAGAKALRDAQLKAAALAFELALERDRGDSEARLRLAHVRMLQGNDKAAVTLLEPLVARPADTPPRVAYLSRLYLAEIRARPRGNGGTAATLLEEAIKLMPSGRSAYVALASVARSAGRHDDMSAALQRMLQAPRSPDDPWLAYRFGQFWVPEALITTLRAEARQQ
jgi:tetratricopeptide (TPR) repeat protein